MAGKSTRCNRRQVAQQHAQLLEREWQPALPRSQPPSSSNLSSMQSCYALSLPPRAYALIQTRALLALAGRRRSLHTVGSAPVDLAASSSTRPSTSTSTHPPASLAETRAEPAVQPDSAAVAAAATALALTVAEVEAAAADPSPPLPAPAARKLTYAEQDALIKERLLERDGGGLSVGEGEWNGLARNVKDNMVRMPGRAAAAAWRTSSTT